MAGYAKFVLLNSWRESPHVSVGWYPADPPGAVRKVAMKNIGLLHDLRLQLPGDWVKVYHRGKDGSSIHYHQHESGKVTLVKHKQKRR